MSTTVEHLEAGRLCLDVCWEKNLVRRLRLGWGGTGTTDTRLSDMGKSLLAALQGYARGQKTDWPDLPLDWDRLSPFSRQVLQKLQREVGQGHVVSYGELAALAGNPKAARAVGRALGANPWPLVVPCHRVIGAGGALTGFTNPGGLELKSYLLELEGAAGSSSRK